jgi:predicted TIM-barrel fold metal-dependent hydrolase
MTRPLFTDTHVHFFELGHERLRYEWLEPEAGPDPDLGDYSAIKSQRYWPDDFVAETRFQHVGRVVHVQAAIGTDDPGDETAWLESFAERGGVPHAIVAYCDLAAPDAADVLGRHLAASSRVRGIRDLRYDEYLTDERWRSGYALLERHGLVACDDPLVEQMEAAADLARSFPGITLCIDHAGFPRERSSEYFKGWRDGMSALASAPNTVVKISGLGMCDHAWTVDSLRDWVLTCIDLWGVQRSFFGSNWPVDRLFSSYGDVLDAYYELVSGFTADEQEALFHGTADRVFGLA